MGVGVPMCGSAEPVPPGPLLLPARGCVMALLTGSLTGPLMEPAGSDAEYDR